MQPAISEETYREFLKTFQSFRDPVALTASSLMRSPLVCTQMQTTSDQLPHQALQACFAAVLAMVAAQNRDYADLLQGRFWEGKQIEEMLTAERPLPMSKRTFSNYQRSAIQTFAFLFLQAENNLSSAVPAASSPMPPEPPVEPLPTAVTPADEVDLLLNQSTEQLTLPTTAVTVTAREARLAPSPPFLIDAQAEAVTTIPWPVAPRRARPWLIGGLLLLLALGVVGFLLRARLPGFGTTADYLFVDDFEQGDAKWNPDSADWAIQVDEAGNHFYCVNTVGPSYTYALAGNTTWQDYTLQLDLKIIATAPGGSGNILWRVADSFHPLYLLDFFAEEDGNGFALEREDGDGITMLDQSLNRLPTQVWLPLRVEVRGGQMQLFVGADPLPALQATDPDPVRQGGIGLGAGFSQRRDDGRWEICFDNIRVTKP